MNFRMGKPTFDLCYSEERMVCDEFKGSRPAARRGRFSAEVLSSLGMGGSAVFGLAEVKRRYLFSESIGE